MDSIFIWILNVRSRLWTEPHTTNSAVWTVPYITPAVQRGRHRQLFRSCYVSSAWHIQHGLTFTPAHWLDGYDMLMCPDKGKTAVHGCHCRSDMVLRMRKVLAIPPSKPPSWCVCFSARSHVMWLRWTCVWVLRVTFRKFLMFKCSFCFLLFVLLSCFVCHIIPE